MKVTRVKWLNHPILGNLELNFTNNATGRPFETVILAGENGTGKTTIIESLGKFLSAGSFQYFEYLEYIINGQIYRAIQQTDQVNHWSFFDVIQPDESIKKIRSDKHNSPAQINQDNTDPRYYGSVLSKARADYQTKKIESATNRQLDVDKYDTDSTEDFTALKQLIIDVENQDNELYAEEHRKKGPAARNWDQFYPASRVFRFKNAFNTFFDKLKYDRVITTEGEKKISFIKNGASIPIDNLSTGEKQVVFRGTYLLKNQSNLNDACIFVDEPELSMHPRWQRNILKYYKDLFTDANGQLVQLFIASHSEHLLKEALSDQTSNIVVVLKENAGIITAHKIDAPSVLPSITSAETNYLAFDIVSNDYHIELYGWLQDKENCPSVKVCDNFIKGHNLYLAATHGRASNFGATTYDTLSTYIRNAIHHPDPNRVFTELELRRSIELLIELCR